jgi:hypothetical protein
MRKMEPLNRHLRDMASDQWRPSFYAIEQIIGTKLPNSARNHEAWWSNDAAPGRQSWAWLDAGFRTADVSLSRGEVRFYRQITATSKRSEGQSESIGLHKTSYVTAPSLEKLKQRQEKLGRYDVALVSCVKSKQEYACAARDLYISPRFRLSRSIAENHADHWFVLSARYGLVDPNDVISPYEQTLKTAKMTARREWAQKVYEAICDRVPTDSTILLLAGFDYAGQLVPLLRHRGHRVVQPLEGLTQGRGLSLLSRMAAVCQ